MVFEKSIYRYIFKLKGEWFSVEQKQASKNPNQRRRFNPLGQFNEPIRNCRKRCIGCYMNQNKKRNSIVARNKSGQNVL